MEENGSARSTRSRALRAGALIAASFAGLLAGALAAGLTGGSVRLLAEIAGFAIYLFLFGRAARELDLDRQVWDHPDPGLLHISGESHLGRRPSASA